jgi:cytochrome c biogenesis protein
MASRQPSDKYVVRKEYNEPIEAPDLTIKSWLRWLWKQLTSMKIALFLLLLLAAASIPGSVYPQRSADPNGVVLFFRNNPDLAPWLDKLQLFDVYSSTWFSSIYLLLFISLVGCVLPRVAVHYKALRADPPIAPTNLSRLPEYIKIETEKDNFNKVEEFFKINKYRTVVTKDEIRAEKGYLRETGNLVFHLSLLGVLISVGLGGALSYSGQRVLVEGESFVNNEAGYDSLSPGLLFDTKSLTPFSLKLNSFTTTYDYLNPTNYAKPIDFTAKVTTNLNGKKDDAVIKVNDPLMLPNAKVYLTGNGYAPDVVIRDKDKNIVFSGPVVFLPQDGNLTSLGVIKVPDAPTQFGIMAFFYPTVGQLETGALTSTHPYPWNALLSMNVFVGKLGLENGLNANVFDLNTHAMKQVAGGKSGIKAIKVKPGETVALPKDLGTLEFRGLKRFASLDITYNPMELWVLVFALSTLFSLILMLIIPRRRIWVKKSAGFVEVAALAKSRDESLGKIVKEISEIVKKKSK